MKFEYIPENDFEKTFVEHFQEELENRRSTLNTEERILMLEEMLMKNQTAGVMENMILKTLANTVLELEHTKIRLQNTESDLRQALCKISSLEQSMASMLKKEGGEDA